MLFAVTGLHGCPAEAGDGHIGAVKDFLFDDQSWKVRWMVVDTGHWLPGRQVLSRSRQARRREKMSR